jgi:hypothetical protein
MIWVTSVLSSQEWINLRDAAQQAFPGGVLARGEIMRRFSLSGVAALRAAGDAEKKKTHQQHQATMCVAGPEGDKPPGGTLGLTCQAEVAMARQPVMVRLTPEQALRVERMGEALWSTEKLSPVEATRRLALTQLLWAESERNMVASVRD